MAAAELVGWSAGEEDRGSTAFLPRRHHGSRRGALEEEYGEDGEERRARGEVRGGWGGSCW
jgi:hypothetical protein